MKDRVAIVTGAGSGIVSLTRSLAVEYGKYNIRLNVICPGTTATEIWEPMVRANSAVFETLGRLCPLGRIARPEEIASVAAFLASDKASFITGAVLMVDGGLTAGKVGFPTA